MKFLKMTKPSVILLVMCFFQWHLEKEDKSLLLELDSDDISLSLRKRRPSRKKKLKFQESFFQCCNNVIGIK